MWKTQHTLLGVENPLQCTSLALIKNWHRQQERELVKIIQGGAYKRELVMIQLNGGPDVVRAPVPPLFSATPSFSSSPSIAESSLPSRQKRDRYVSTSSSSSSSCSSSSSSSSSPKKKKKKSKKNH